MGSTVHYLCVGVVYAGDTNVPIYFCWLFFSSSVVIPSVFIVYFQHVVGGRFCYYAPC